jgi:hypothetical protein
VRQRLRSRFALATAACLLATACSGLGSWSRDDADTRRRAQIERTEYLELEIARLKADLSQAEEAMLAIGAGRRGGHTRAQAVSNLAEARISVERAGESAAWRRSQLEEARAKLEEAERQIQAGHSSAAFYFASRARRIADTLNQEARRVAESPGAKLVDRPQVNLRAGPSDDEPILGVITAATPVFPEQRKRSWWLVRTPSGQLGWVHTSLLRDR